MEQKLKMVKPLKITSILLLALTTLACGPNQTILNSASETPPPPSNIQPAEGNFESDILAMRNADFNYIYAFRRKDGRAMDADDKRFVNSNTPSETNRRRVSTDGKVIILGSNYRFPPEMLKNLTDRFIFEDYSKPDSEIMQANTNSQH